MDILCRIGAIMGQEKVVILPPKKFRKPMSVSDHRGCKYHATAVGSLFRQYCLHDGEIVGDINATRSLLLYVADGILSVRSGVASPQRADRGTLLFVRRGIGFNGEASGSCRLIASFFSGPFPLCDQYGIEEAQQESPQFYERQLSPPPGKFRN